MTTSWIPIVVSIGDSEIYTWESQASQYPATGAEGIDYFRGDIPDDRGWYVDCLLHRDSDGSLSGILNRYPFDMPPWEQENNVCLFVRPDRQRQGIATALFDEAVRRWNVNLNQQRFTAAGTAWAMEYALRSGR